MSQGEFSEEPFTKHLAALRTCLIRAILATLGCMAVTGYFAKDLYQILSLPMRAVLPAGSHFITTHPVEAWLTYFKTSLFSSAFLASPVIFYQIWSFIAPGLLREEKRKFLFVILFTSLLFIFGGLFGYFVAFPAAFSYLSGILDGTDILYFPRMEDYLGFSFQLLIGFGVIFETPLVILALAATGIVTKAQLSAFRRYYIVLAFIVSAVLTPPDVVSQTIMALPLLLLYEVGVAGAWLLEKRAAAATVDTEN